MSEIVKMISYRTGATLYPVFGTRWNGACFELVELRPFRHVSEDVARAVRGIESAEAAHIIADGYERRATASSATK